MPPLLGIHTGAPATFGDNLRRLAADRFAKADVRHQSIAEERVDAMTRTINKLIGNDKVQWPMLFLQRTYGREREYSLDSELLKAVNVGAEVQFRGHDAVTAAVTGKKCHFTAWQACRAHRRLTALRMACQAILHAHRSSRAWHTDRSHR